jgi:basic membrane protein A and related proteins
VRLRGASAAILATAILATAILATAILATALVSAGCSRPPSRAAAAGPSRRIGIVLEGASGDSRGSAGELAAAALERLVRERGGRLSEGPEEGRGRPAGLDALVLHSRLEGRDDEQLLRFLAGEGRDLVIAVGPRFLGSLARVARDFPRLRFAVIGAGDGGRAAAPNVTAIAFDEAQAAFMVGAFAGLMVGGESAAKLGFIGGMEGAATRSCQAGFQAGAAWASPGLRRPGFLLAQNCGRTEAAFSDPAAAQAIAVSQFRKGASIVFHAAGASGRGLFAAASAAGRLAIGSGGDRLSECVVAATRDRADVAIALLVDELFATGTVRPGLRLIGLKEGAVGYDVDDTRKATLVAFLPRLEEARGKILSGEIQVPGDEESAARFVKALK